MKLDNLGSVPTKEMVDWFDERTAKHINLVKQYAQKIAEKFPELSKIAEQVKYHDSSKYVAPEYKPYVYITWRYKMADKGVDYDIPDDVDETKATMHHITSNSHHPEFYDPNVSDDSLNQDDRDALPNKMVDATAMPDVDIAEMVADWCAMSKERGNSPKEWANKTVNKRWKFTKHQTDLIYKLIDAIWNE